MVGSVYMESSPEAGYMQANYSRFFRLAEHVRFLGLPYIIAGDWNQSPQQYQVSGFADMFKGVPLQCKVQRGRDMQISGWEVLDD